MKELETIIAQVRDLEKAADALIPKLEKLNTLMKEIVTTGIKITAPGPKA